MATTRQKGAGIIVSHDVREATIVRPQNPLPDIVGDLQKYDTGTFAFTTLASMNKSRGGFALYGFGSSLIAIGGTDGSVIHSQAELYDIGSNSWTLKNPMSIARCYFQSAQDSNIVYVAGGLTSSGLGELSISNVLEKYDINTDTWTTLTPIPDTFGVAFGVAHIYNNALYILCGHCDNIGTPNKYILKYNILLDTWDTPFLIVGVDDLKLYERALPFSFIKSDTVYCINGIYEDVDFTQGETKFQRSGVVKIYLPTLTISSGDNEFDIIPESRYAGASASSGNNNYFLGGTNATSNTLRFFEKIDSSGSPFVYTTLSNIAKGKSSFSAAINGTGLYFCGGVRSQLGTNYVRVEVESIPSRIRLDGHETGSIRIRAVDENGDAPASVTILITATYTPVSGSNTVLFVSDIVTVHNGYGTATLMPRSDDGQGSITMGTDKERTYNVSVSASVYDPYYLGETAPDLTPPDTTNFAAVDPSQSLGDVSLPSYVKSCGDYSSVILPSQAIQGAYLQLKNIGGFISLTPSFQIANTTSVQWYSDIDWLPVVNGIIDTNAGTYSEVYDALERMKPSLQFGGSTLLDAILKASDILSLDQTGYRKFIYVLSDGEEHGSHTTLSQVTSSLLALSPVEKVPVSSLVYKLNGSNVYAPKVVRQDSTELDSLAISLDGTAKYITSTADTSAFLSAKGSVGSGYFTFEIDFGEEIQISTVSGLFTVGNKSFANWKYQLGNDIYVFEDWSREYEITDTVNLQNTFARFVRFQINLGICFSCSAVIPSVQAVLNTINITYHQKTTSYIFLNNKESTYPLHQIVVAFDASTYPGGEINVGVNSQKTANWDDYHLTSRPALDNGSKIVMPIRYQLDPNVVATLEQLVNIDGFLFEAKYGKWTDDSIVKVMTTAGVEIAEGLYFSYPSKGYIVFNEKQTGEFILSIENKSNVSVAAEIINRVNSHPIVISGAGYMYSTTETKGFTQKTSSILPEALNVMLVPFAPDVNSIFTAIYTYYDLAGRAEKDTIIKWYINGSEEVDLLGLIQWDNKEWKLAKSGDSISFTVQPFAKGTEMVAGRIIQSIPVKLS